MFIQVCFRDFFLAWPGQENEAGLSLPLFNAHLSQYRLFFLWIFQQPLQACVCLVVLIS